MSYKLCHTNLMAYVGLWYNEKPPRKDLLRRICIRNFTHLWRDNERYNRSVV